MLTGNQVGEILSRHERGEGKVRIAKAMGISTKTVARYLKMSPEEASLARSQDRQKPCRSCQLDEHKQLIEQFFWDADGNCQNVRERLATDHDIQVNLRSLQWYCKEKLGIRKQHDLAHSKAARHSQRMETLPGQELQIDFGEKDVVVDGSLRRIHFFVATLGYSRRMHAVFYTFENMEAWIGGLEKTFLRFKGVPRFVVCDNAKALVFKAWHKDQAPIYARDFSAFCRYWGTRPQACRPGTPQHKGKVERSVQYIQDSFLKDFRNFSSLEDMQAKFELWESGIAAKREMMTADAEPIHFTPADRFKVEARALAPVFKPPIAEYRLETRRVSASGHVTIDNQRFTLPEDLRNLTVDVLIGRADVIVCHKGRTITRLDKAADACKPITRILKKDSILRAANTTMMPKSDFQRSLEVYEEAAR